MIPRRCALSPASDVSLPRREHDAVSVTCLKSAISATGTIVDAATINATASTKNADNARDPEMHQNKKGNEWFFEMKSPISALTAIGRCDGGERTVPSSVILCTVKRPGCGRSGPPTGANSASKGP
jgi:hypothetical protein